MTKTDLPKGKLHVGVNGTAPWCYGHGARGKQSVNPRVAASCDEFLAAPFEDRCLTCSGAVGRPEVGASAVLIIDLVRFGTPTNMAFAARIATHRSESGGPLEECLRNVERDRQRLARSEQQLADLQWALGALLERK